MNEYVTVTEMTLLCILAALVLVAVVKGVLGKRSAYVVEGDFASVAFTGDVTPAPARPLFSKESEPVEPFMFKVSGAPNTELHDDYCMHMAGLKNGTFID